MVIQVIGAFFAVTTFAIIYNVPKRFLLYCGIVGATGWLTNLLMLQVNQKGFIGAFVATLVISLFSHIFARVFKAPVTVLLIPGILPLVPGVGMYRIAYYMITNESKMTSYYFNYSLQIAGAIAIAIFIMDTLFRLFQKKV